MKCIFLGNSSWFGFLFNICAQRPGNNCIKIQYKRFSTRAWGTSAVPQAASIPMYKNIFFKLRTETLPVKTCLHEKRHHHLHCELSPLRYTRNYRAFVGVCCIQIQIQIQVVTMNIILWSALKACYERLHFRSAYHPIFHFTPWRRRAIWHVLPAWTT